MKLVPRPRSTIRPLRAGERPSAPESAAGHRPYNKERFRTCNDSLRQRRVGRLVREILFARVEADDGWIVAAATQARVHAACPDARALTRAAAVARLSASGIAAAPVLEIDEVLQHPTLVGRRSLCRVPCGADAQAPVFAAPLGMAAVRPARVPAFEDEAKEWNEA